MAKEHRSRRVLILTDRRLIHDQLLDNFRQYGIPVVSPESGRQLMTALEDRSISVILTMVQMLSMLKGYCQKDPADWVILTEEDRPWTGAYYHDLHEMLPGARHFSFVSNPFFKDGKFLLPSEEPLLYAYPLKNAVEDGILLPVHYFQAQEQMQIWYELLEDMPGAKPEAAMFFTSRGFVARIGKQLIDHFHANLKGTGLKAILVARNHEAAINFQEYFDEMKRTGRSVNAATVVGAGQQSTDDAFDAQMLQQFNEAGDDV